MRINLLQAHRWILSQSLFVPCSSFLVKPYSALLICQSGGLDMWGGCSYMALTCISWSKSLLVEVHYRIALGFRQLCLREEYCL